MSDYVVGVDLGGTQIRAALADLDGKIVARDQRLTLADEGPEAVIARVVESVHSAAGENSFRDLGIGAPGPTDPNRGVLLTAANLPGWHHVNLRDALYQNFGVPVYLGNDANLAGLAEHRFGAGRGATDMIYITVSTGIGSGIIVGGKLLVGAQGLAAEIGHTTINLDAEAHDSGIVGTLEGLASGPDIAERAQRTLRGGAQSRVLEQVEGNVEAVSGKELGRAAAGGDEFALEQFRIAGRYIGVGITNLLHIFNPQRIVIGGSVWMHTRQFMEETVWATIKERSQSEEYWKWLKIVPAMLGGDVGLLGAVALALGELQK